jgi:amino acid transporter
MAAPARIPNLRRELGPRHLALFAIAAVTGTRPIAEAAHAGAGSVTLWILAAAGVLMPLAAACAILTVRQPVSGGLYQWARHDFGPWHGFLCFWMYWIGIAFWFPAAAMLYVSVGIRGLGYSYAHLADNRICVLLVSLSVIWIALGTNLVGLRIGKWTENLGAVCGWFLCVVLGVAGLAVWLRGGSATPMQIVPKWDWATASFWPNIAMGMTGIELVGMMGDEIVDPALNVPRAATIASVFAGIFYISITLALLVLIPSEDISELYGLAQGGATAARMLGLPALGPLVALLVIGNAIGQFGSAGSAASRLPLAAGMDNLLPAAFARVHPRWATPHVSILLLGIVASVLIIAVQTGDTMMGAYQALVSLMVIGSFLPFLYIYASAWKAGAPIIASIGMSVTALVLACSAIPTGAVKSVWLFEAKLVAGTLGMIGSAWLVYRSRRHGHEQARPPS